MGEVEPLVIKVSDKTGVFTREMGGAKIKNFITRQVGSKRIHMSYMEIPPRGSAHRWHTHKNVDEDSRVRVKYPEGFEQVYFIVKGRGSLQLKTSQGVKGLDVNELDAIFFPQEVVEHQVINRGSESLVIVAVGSPPLEVTVK